MHIINALTSVHLLRKTVLTIFVILVLHSLFAAGAYFTFNLGVNPLDRVNEWYYLIGNDPAFVGNKLPVALLVLVLWITTPVLLVWSGIQIVLTLWRRRGEMSSKQKSVGVFALFMAAIMFPLMASPFGYAVGLWFFD